MTHWEVKAHIAGFPVAAARSRDVGPPPPVALGWASTLPKGQPRHHSLASPKGFLASRAGKVGSQGEGWPLAFPGPE